jgi:hypothetical protein
MLGQDLFSLRQWKYDCHGHYNRAGEHNSRSDFQEPRNLVRIAFKLSIVVLTAARG